MNQNHFNALSFDSGVIQKIQSNFLEISLNRLELTEKYRINFIEKRETKIRLNFKFKCSKIYEDHILNSELNENLYEIYFVAKTYDSFCLLFNKYKNIIDEIYFPYKTFNSFINKYFLKLDPNMSNISGKLGLANKNVLMKLIENIIPEIEISSIPLNKTHNTRGKVLILDSQYVWSKDFKIDKLFVA